MGGPKDKTTAPGNNFFEDDDFFEDENTGEVEPAAPADDPPAPAPTEPDPLAVVAGGSSAPVSEADQADQAEGGFGAELSEEPWFGGVMRRSGGEGLGEFFELVEFEESFEEGSEGVEVLGVLLQELFE